MRDGDSCGVFVNFGAKGRLERCELWGNADGGVVVVNTGGPTLTSCTIRDHVAGRAVGVWVDATARGGATGLLDCIFARNARGDVLRK